MSAFSTPMRWPAAWADPATLALLKGTGIDALLIDNSDEFEPIRTRATQSGLQVHHPDAPPDGVRIVKGEWPGVRMARGAGGVDAGPTGVPWVDSNGWAVRLAAAMHPDRAAWIDAPPPKQPFPVSYLTAIADTAAYGGRWIVSLDDALATGIAAGKANALATWKMIGQATAFFAAHKDWQAFTPAAAVGVVSSFTGDNEFFNQELLNLLSRAGQHSSVLRKESVKIADMRGLRAVIYADSDAPSAALRKELTAFVAGGGLLITTPVWGDAPTKVEAHPRYYGWTAGKGNIARSIAPPDDPYQMANDAVVLISHRHDLVRFWNAGAAGSYYAVSPDRKKALVHLLFYANRGPDVASVRIAGPYRRVKASMVDTPEIAGVRAEPQKDAVEVYLPQVSQYVALELSI
jgi:hypothetical protein